MEREEGRGGGAERKRRRVAGCREFQEASLAEHQD